MDSFIKHAGLIWQQDGCTVDQARHKAWCEGPEGYKKRLEAQKENLQHASATLAEIEGLEDKQSG